jgi:hypothetical protein
MVGIRIAFLGSFSQIYVIEAMQPQIRGSLISMYFVFISIGSIVGRYLTAQRELI